MVSESFRFTGPFISWFAWTELSDLPWTFLLLGMVIWIIIFFLSNKEGKIVDFKEYSRYFQKPKPSYPSQANSHKVWTLQPKLSLRSSTVRCSSAALSSDYITWPVALVQHCSGRGAAQRSSRHAAAAGRLRSISLVCVLHNTITLTLTAVRTVKQIHSLKNVDSLVEVPLISLSFYPETTNFSYVSPSWHWQRACYGLDQSLRTRWML